MAVSPHKSLKHDYKGTEAIVEGKYLYFHYGCQNVNDNVLFGLNRDGDVLTGLYRLFFHGLF